MTLNRFISYSIIIHLLAVSFLYLIPARKEQKGEPFFARLVTPEDTGPRHAAPPPVDRQKPPLPISPAKPQAVPVPPPIVRPAPHPPSPDPSPTLLVPQTGSPHIPEEGSPPSRGEAAPRPDIGTPKSGTPAPSIKERLFDRDIIEKFAKRAEQKEKNSITFDTKEFQYYGYMRRLKEKIEGVWKYPPDAAMRGIYGDLYIMFTIKKDGTLGAVELVRTSGHKSLDEAAIKALKDAVPYWPLPEEWGKDGLTIRGHFVYSIYGAYVR